MQARLLTLLFLTAGVAHAQSNTLFVSGNVMTGQTWHAPQDPGGGTSGSCSPTSNVVQYYSRPFFTDTTGDAYQLYLYYESFQSGFVYVYADAFQPGDPCAGELVFGFAPIANITNIHLDANRQYVFVTSEDVLYGGGGSFQTTIHGPAGVHMSWGDAPSAYSPFCFGDGSGTACPCGNASNVGEDVGCLSSLGAGGSLRASGAASLAGDTLHLMGTQMPNSSALFFQGTARIGGGAGGAFGDGLRCAGGTIVRLATESNAGGGSQFPGVGEPPLSVRGQVAAPGVRTYQVWYRNAAAFCTASTFNLTNAVEVQWTP